MRHYLRALLFAGLFISIIPNYLYAKVDRNLSAGEETNPNQPDKSTDVVGAVPSTMPGNEIEQPTLDMVQFGSIAGIMVMTTIVVSVLKRILSDSVFAKVPVFVHVTLVSFVLVAFARYVLKSLDGNIGILLWDTLKVALASSGFYTWVIEGKAVTLLTNTAGGASYRKGHNITDTN